MKIAEIIDFLETDTLSVTYSSLGLKYLSLRNNNGAQLIHLKSFIEGKDQDSISHLIIKETMNFLETGSHNMPLDLTAFTDFQRQVFETVGRIKVGSIATYKNIGEALGKPGAAQAVGSAVAKNPVSYFIPTHRVLPQKGIGICRSGAGFLRQKLLVLEGNDISQLMGNYECKRKNCGMDLL